MLERPSKQLEFVTDKSRESKYQYADKFKVRLTHSEVYGYNRYVYVLLLSMSA